MKRKAFALVLVLAMLCSTLPLTFASSAEESTPTPGDAVVAKLDGTDITLNALTEQLKTDDCSGKTLQLTQDIVVDAWTSVPVFRGTLDGAGFGISGLNAPLFIQLDQATVKNLTVEGNLTAVISGNEAGLLAGHATNGVRVENAVTKGSITVGGSSTVLAGGFFGQANDADMKNCINQADILVSTTGGTSLLGGLIGQVAKLSNFLGVVKLQNCANYGDIIDSAVSETAHRGGSKSGGMIGVVNNAGSDVTATLCYNSGSISANCLAGGIFADVRGNLTMEDCVNTGAATVTRLDSTSSSNAFAGGMVASFYNVSYASICGCINTGASSVIWPTGNNSRAGGIVGTTNRVLEVRDCFNSGDISARNMAGGIAGEMGATATSSHTYGILNCVSVGTVSSNDENGPDSNIRGLLGALGNHSGGKNMTFRLENSYYLAAEGLSTMGTSLGNGYWASGNGFAVVLTYGADTQTLQQESQDFLEFVAEIDTQAAEAGARADADAIDAEYPIHAVGLQQTAVDGTYDIRLLAGLNSLEYSAAGFELIRLEEGGALSAVVERSTDTVYTSVTGYDETGAEQIYSASDFGCSYLSAVTVTGIPADRTVTFLMRPYLTSMDGEIQYCGPACLVTFVNGVLQAAE